MKLVERLHEELRKPFVLSIEEEAGCDSEGGEMERDM